MTYKERLEVRRAESALVYAKAEGRTVYDPRPRRPLTHSLGVKLAAFVKACKEAETRRNDAPEVHRVER